jgi:hypothetical protein
LADEQEAMMFAKALMASAAAFLFAVSTAQAGFIYTLNVPNSALSPFPVPYGQVEVTLLDSNTAHIKLSSLNPNYLFGDGSSLAINTNGTATRVTPYAFTQPADSYFNSPSFVDDGAKNVSDFGNFNFTVKNNGGAKEAVLSIEFNIDKSTGTWSSDSNVLTPNSDGFSAAAHVFVFDSKDYSGGAALTGFAGNGDGDQNILSTPEPTSMALLISGMGFIGLVGMRRLGLRRPSIVN